MPARHPALSYRSGTAPQHQPKIDPALRLSYRAERSWQARRESNPQPPVLETGALPIELLAYAGLVHWAGADKTRTRRCLLSPRYLFRLPMNRVRAAPTTIFPKLQPTRRFPLILGRTVITPLAAGARQRNNATHGPTFDTPGRLAPSPL